MVRGVRIELTTPTVSMWCSTTELTAHNGFLFSIFPAFFASSNSALAAEFSISLSVKR